jgi:hypothetical protein
MIPKIRMNKEQTSRTLVIEGRDAIRALVTSLIPSFLEIILRGLRALNALRALRAWSDYRFMPLNLVIRSRREAITTKASSKFQ